MTATTVRRLMARHHLTIADVAVRWNLTKTRVRQVRALGGPWDWPWMLTTMARERAALKRH